MADALGGSVRLFRAFGMGNSHKTQKRSLLECLVACGVGAISKIDTISFPVFLEQLQACAGFPIVCSSVHRYA